VILTTCLFGRYLAELLAERQKLAPFVQVLPFCTRLLNQEILRASTMVPNHNFVDHNRIEHGSPLRLPGHPVNGQPMDLEGWSGMQTEQMGVLQASSMGWNGAPALVGTPVVKKALRLDVLVDKYPNYKFVGRLLGPEVTP
jgi:protein quaking